MLLLCWPRTMQSLPTGFWISNKSSYNHANCPTDTRDQPYTGLGLGLSQGSGGLNPGFTLTAAPMIRTYKRKKFHAGMKSAWSGLLMTLTAIMTLTTWTCYWGWTKIIRQRIFEFIQAAIDFWGIFVMASGGSLKQKKCQVVIASFNFLDGRPRLQQLKSLPEHPFELSQKDCMTAPIPTKSAEEEVTALGFANNFKNSGHCQVKTITNKGNNWASNMNSNPYLRRDDVWLSLSTQLQS